MTFSLECSSPASPEYGNVALLNNGETAVYSCDIQTTLLGDNTRNCSISGLGWSGTQPTCSKYKKYLAPRNTVKTGDIATDDHFCFSLCL